MRSQQSGCISSAQRAPLPPHNRVSPSSLPSLISQTLTIDSVLLRPPRDTVKLIRLPQTRRSADYVRRPSDRRQLAGQCHFVGGTRGPGAHRSLNSAAGAQALRLSTPGLTTTMRTAYTHLRTRH